MRPKTNRRLRVAVVFVVAALVAVIAGSAVALATVDPTPGSGYEGEYCVKLFETNSMVAGSSGSNSASVTLPGGQVVTVTISWNADLVFSVSVSGGELTYLFIKGGTGSWGEVAYSGAPTSSVGGLHCGTQQPEGQWQELSHLWICLIADEPPEYGSLKITKTVDGYNPGGVGPEHFGVQVTGVTPLTYDQHFMFPSDGVLVINDLELGTYNIVEDNPGYPFTAQSANGVVVNASPQTVVSFTNTGVEELGSLEITKTIAGYNKYEWGPDHFGVTVTGVAPLSYSQHFMFPPGGVLTINNLHAGTYNIVEDDPGLPFSAQGLYGVVVNHGEKTSVGITNTGVEDPGSLRITKTVTGYNPEGWDPSHFGVTVTGVDVTYSQHFMFPSDGVLVVDNLEPGHYNIVEDVPGYPFSVESVSGVEVEYDEETEVSIINTGVEELGSLEITKTIDGHNPDSVEPDYFGVTVTGRSPLSYDQHFMFPNDGVLLIENLHEGTYDIVEDDPGYPFSAQSADGVVVNHGEKTSVGITNTGVPEGSLRITKTIAGDNPGDLDYEDFRVVVTGPTPDSLIVFNGHFDSNGEIVVTGLKPGIYTITEQAPGYPFTVSGEGPVSVDADQETGVTIINTGSTTTTTQAVLTTETTVRTTGTTVRTTGTTVRTTGTTVLGFSNTTVTTVFGWVAQPDDVQTGLGGTAGGSGNWALIVLVLASTLLTSVLVASAVGVRAGLL